MIPFLKILRASISPIAWTSGAMAAATFLVATFLPDNYRYMATIWKASAIAGMFAFALDKWLDRSDARESKRLRDELDTTKTILTETKQRAETSVAYSKLLEERVAELNEKLSQANSKLNTIDSRTSPRRINEPTKRVIVAMLKNQNHFAKFAIRYAKAGGDCGQFAHELHSALIEAGWEIADPLPPAFDSPYPFAFVLSKKNAETIPMPMAQLMRTLMDLGVLEPETKIQPNDAIPDGTLGMYIGIRP